MISEIENQLENLGSAWLNCTEKVDKMQIQSQVDNLKHSEGFTLALFNLISKPQTDEKIVLFMIGTLKEEAKYVFSDRRQSAIGNEP